MCSMALQGGEGRFYFTEEDVDVQPVCARMREGTLPNVKEKVEGGGNLTIHFAYHKPELL